MKRVMFPIIFAALATPLTAQWLKYPTPGTPRNADGKPSLAVYICPAAAERWVTNGGRGTEDEGRVEEELVRLTVHGTLHVLGYDHPHGPGRTRSAMWGRQERYVRRLLGSGGKR